MSEGLQKLQEIGAQKIYEETHIPIWHVQAILYESFEGFNRVQFLGFVSILEREYGVDLQELQQNGEAYFDTQEEAKETLTSETIFSAAKNKPDRKPLYIVIALLLLGVAAYYWMEHQQERSMGIDDLEKNTTLLTRATNDANKSEPKKEQALLVATDENETNSSAALQKEESAQHDAQQQEKTALQEGNTIAAKSSLQTPKATVTELVIAPRMRVWLGYVDVKSNRRYQKTFKEPLTLDPKREWLFYFGHGNVDIIINGEKEKFAARRPLRLHYKDGTIQKITTEEFRRLNRGNKW